MPFELRKSFAFEASHVLAQHGGKCARLHGHSYVLTLVLRGVPLHRSGPSKNMLLDFNAISAAAKGVVASHLDHHHLNDSLGTDSPTAEYIARWVFRRLAPRIGPRLAEVELRETATAVVVYRPGERTRRRVRQEWNGSLDGSGSESERESEEEEEVGSAFGNGHGGHVVAENGVG